MNAPTNRYSRGLAEFLVLSVLLLGLPLLGAALAGRPVAPYLQFPPRTDFVRHAPFAWPAFMLTAAASAALFGGLLWLLRPWRRPPIGRAGPRSLPWWGWLALAWLAAVWVAAWSRGGLPGALRAYAFPALWLGYIVLANALAWRRSGRSLLTHRTGYLLGLFPASAVFWWYFEYLNRFVQNWHYVGIGSSTAASYVGHATLAFSTVLPAVLSTAALLRSFAPLSQTRRLPPLPLRHPRRLAALALAAAAFGLLGIAVFPDRLYPLLWAAPLVLIVSLQTLFGDRTYLQPLRTGDWERVALPALAALVCGFFWEMWNYYSEPKWVYSIAYVHRFQVFEMPVLGYTGYLPFGVECAVIADFVGRWRHGEAQQDPLRVSEAAANRSRTAPSRAVPR